MFGVSKSIGMLSPWVQLFKLYPIVATIEGIKFCPLIIEGVALPQGLISILAKRVYLGLSEVAFIEGCLHVRDGLYERREAEGGASRLLI